MEIRKFTNGKSVKLNSFGAKYNIKITVTEKVINEIVKCPTESKPGKILEILEDPSLVNPTGTGNRGLKVFLQSKTAEISSGGKKRLCGEVTLKKVQEKKDAKRKNKEKKGAEKESSHIIKIVFSRLGKH